MWTTTKYNLILELKIEVTSVVNIVPGVTAASTAAVDAVRVGRRLTVAEVARVAAPLMFY